MHISNYESGVTAKELASTFGVTMAAITHNIKELEQEGYIHKVQDSDDKRVSYISLTNNGYKLLHRVEESHKTHLASMVEYLGEEDSEKLLEILNKLSDWTCTPE